MFLLDIYEDYNIGNYVNGGDVCACVAGMGENKVALYSLIYSTIIAPPQNRFYSALPSN